MIKLRGKVQVVEGFVTSSSLVAKDYVFLDHSHTLYSKRTSSDPHRNGQCDISKNKEFNGTLHGSYSFPFSLPFPETVEWNNKGRQGQDSRNASMIPVLSYDPPPSFREKNMSSAVVYEFGVVITHGALRSKSRWVDTSLILHIQ